MFIFGHVSSWTANGIFHDLKDLQAGNQVIVERGDGYRYTYIVREIKIYAADRVNMQQVLAPLPPYTPG